MRSLGAYAHHGKVGGDAPLDQGVVYVRSKTGNKPVDAQCQSRFNEFFVKEVRDRSKWADKAKELNRKYKRLLKVPDWRDPSRIVKYKSLVHRWGQRPDLS